MFPVQSGFTCAGPTLCTSWVTIAPPRLSVPPLPLQQRRGDHRSVRARREIAVAFDDVSSSGISHRAFLLRVRNNAEGKQDCQSYRNVDRSAKHSFSLLLDSRSVVLRVREVKPRTLLKAKCSAALAHDASDKSTVRRTDSGETSSLYLAADYTAPVNLAFFSFNLHFTPSSDGKGT